MNENRDNQSNSLRHRVGSGVRFWGIVAGVLGSVFYGTNPLGTLPLYGDGISSGNVLFYRYGFSVAIFAVWLLLRGESLSVKRGHAIRLAILGVMFAFSSLTLYESFHYMDAGVASTILFSSLLYAFYIVSVRQFCIEGMSAEKFTAYVVFFGWLTLMAFSALTGTHFQLLHGTQWLWGLQLALLPTVLSIFLINVAIKRIGATPTAIMGALEPVTAVIISCSLFGERFTMRLAIGIALILSAVILIILRKQKINDSSL